MDTSTIGIYELNGVRSVVLSGAGLPFKPAEWSSKQALKTTWYPGNDRASQQVLGPQDPPSKWAGRWSRVQLGRTPVRYTDDTGNTQQLVRPLDVKDAIEAIQRGGSALRVIWTTDEEGDAADITREGRISEFTYKVMTSYDLEWEMAFEWTGREGSSVGQGVTNTRADNTASAGTLMTAMTNYLSGVQSLNMGIGPLPNQPPAAPFSANPTLGIGLGLNNAYLSIGIYETLSQAVIQTVFGFSETVSEGQQNLNTLQQVYTTEGNQSFATSNTFADFAAHSSAETSTTKQLLGQVPIELMSNTQQLSDVTNAVSTFGQAWGFMSRLGGTAKDLELNARQNQSSGPGGPAPTANRRVGSPFQASGVQATHVCRQRETIVTVSMQYFNSPDFCMLILKANHMPWWTVDLPVGKILAIPNQPTQQGGVSVGASNVSSASISAS